MKRVIKSSTFKNNPLDILQDNDIEEIVIDSNKFSDILNDINTLQDWGYLSYATGIVGNFEDSSRLERWVESELEDINLDSLDSPDVVLPAPHFLLVISDIPKDKNDRILIFEDYEYDWESMYPSYGDSNEPRYEEHSNIINIYIDMYGDEAYMTTEEFKKASDQAIQSNLS